MLAIEDSGQRSRFLKPPLSAGRPGPSNQLRRQRLLVVEDDFDIRRGLHEVLEDQGYEVVNASNGFEGLELLRLQRTPSLILLDLMMPVLNGENFLTALRANAAWAKIPVFILSVRPPPPLPVTAYFRKPFDLPRLLQAIKVATAPSSPEGAH